jgi:hypothetical protein
MTTLRPQNLWYKPRLIIRNISTSDITVLGRVNLRPGQRVDAFKIFPPGDLTEDMVITELFADSGDLHREVVKKRTLVVDELDLPSFHFSVNNPTNFETSNAYFPGAILTIDDDGKLLWAAAKLPLKVEDGYLELPQATPFQDGFLSKEDYVAFAGQVLNGVGIRIWQYQDFAAGVGGSLTLSDFQNGSSVAFNDSWIKNGTAQIVLQNDHTSPPTSTISIPGKWLPSSRVFVSSHVGANVILNQAPHSSQAVRIYYQVDLPPAQGLPAGYEEDPEFANDITLKFLDDNYVNQNQDESVYGSKTWEDAARFNANVGIGKDAEYPLDVLGTIQTTGFRMPTGAVDGYILTSDADGVGSWSRAAEVVQGSEITDGYFDGYNRIFFTPQKFQETSTLKLYLNGQLIFRDGDYTVSESEGINTGFDTISLEFDVYPGDKLFLEFVPWIN